MAANDGKGLEQVRQSIKAVIGIVRAVGEAIAGFGSVENTRLWLECSNHLTLSQYNLCLDMLKEAGLVTEKFGLLTWVGPEIPVFKLDA